MHTASMAHKEAKAVPDFCIPWFYIRADANLVCMKILLPNVGPTESHRSSSTKNQLTIKTTKHTKKVSHHKLSLETTNLDPQAFKN